MSAVLVAAVMMLLPLQGQVELAEQAYRDGRYGQAQRLFEAALAMGSHPEGPLLYNIGNCAYRLGHHAEAVLYYRRARLRLPGNRDVRDNLRLAEQELGIFTEPDGSIAAGLSRWLGALPASPLLWLSAALQTVGLCGLVLLRRNRSARAGMAFVFLIGMAGGARVVWSRVLPAPPDGVVLADRIAVRAEPHRQTGVLLTLQAGELVRVEEWSDRWARITHPRGGGWTQRAGIGIVD